MGVVYKARDLKLERFVALKFLASHLIPSRTAHSRFLQEARAISSLNHPNIATIYDVEQAEDQMFLVLEYLPGGSLRSVVLDLESSGHKLSIEQVLTYARQMGEGLAHAHRNGIWHRDVKTGNALLSAEGTLKITDFGLAKFRSGAHLTQARSRLGTAAYMSPEQAQGKEVDQRSDIFSFGVVLYELATCELPFRAEHEAGLIHQILNISPPPLKQRRPEIPGSFQQIVERALQKKPEERYQRMEEALIDLRSLSETLKAPRPREHQTPPTITLEPTPGPRHSRRRLALMLSGAAMAVLLSGLLFFWPRQSVSAVSEGSPVLLTEVENRTGDQQLNAVTDILRSQLGQSAYFNLMEPTRIRAVLERMVRPPDDPLKLETAREIAWRAGVPLVISGSLAQLGSGYVLNLRVERIGDQPTPTEARYQAFNASGKDKIFEAIHQGSNWVRRMAGEKPRDLAQRDRRVEETTTDSWEALDLYSRAERLRAQSRFEDAVLLLKEAVKIDPHFALGYALLGDILLEVRKYGEGYRCYQEALSAMGVRRLTKREELRIQALYAIDSGDARSAEALYRSYSLHYPNDYYPLYYRGLALEQVGQEEEAIAQFREAEKKRPAHYPIVAHLAMAYMVRGRFADVAVYIERLRNLKQDEWANFLEGASAFLQGNSQQAMERFTGLGQSQDSHWQSRSYALRACLLAELGKCGDAVRVLKEGIAFDTQKSRTVSEADKLLALAYLHYRTQDFSALKAACLKALQLDTSPHRVLKAGTLLARVGSLQQAQELLPGLVAGGDAHVFRAAIRRISGEVLLSRGNKAQALREFREADALEPSARPREYLARALAAIGDREGALQLYRKIVESQGFIWRAPDDQFPGLWADSLFQYAKLASSAGKYEESERATVRYLGIREHADLGAYDVVAARKTLEQLRSKQGR